MVMDVMVNMSSNTLNIDLCLEPPPAPKKKARKEDIYCYLSPVPGLPVLYLCSSFDIVILQMPI